MLALLSSEAQEFVRGYFQDQYNKLSLREHYYELGYSPVNIFDTPQTFEIDRETLTVSISLNRQCSVSRARLIGSFKKDDDSQCLLFLDEYLNLSRLTALRRLITPFTGEPRGELQIHHLFNFFRGKYLAQVRRQEWHGESIFTLVHRDFEWPLAEEE